jgi:hypothetical protein
LQAGTGSLTLNGLDSVDSDGSFGGADSNTLNTIQRGTNSIILTAGVNNPTASNLTYTFSIDINNNGSYSDAGETISTIVSNSGTGAFTTYNPSALAAGSYNTQVTVSDGASFNSIQNSTLKISTWSLNGLDSSDTDAVFNNGTDTSPANIVAVGSTSINLSTSVNNPNSAALTYTFFVDTNRDGDFNDTGEQVYTGTSPTDRGNSSGTQWRSIGYNPSSLALGTYQTKLVLSEAATAFTQEAYDSFSIAPRAWQINGIDSIDQDAVFGNGSDSNLNNTIVQGTTGMRLTSSIANPAGAGITSFNFFVETKMEILMMPVKI